MSAAIVSVHCCIKHESESDDDVEYKTDAL